MATVTLACQAMATRFELVLHGDDPIRLRAAGEEALGEIERLEDQLSLYRPESEIALLNARAATAPVQVSPRVFSLLQHAARLHQETGGAFDVTIAPLVRCWGFMGGTGQLPAPSAIAEARQRVGMHLVHLDPANFTVRFERPGVMLDLGAIGKGYAIDCAVEILRETGVTSALLHGGTSTAYALSHPPGAEHWILAIDAPKHAVENGTLARIALKDEALSVSDIGGKSFAAEGRLYGHVIDPRSGEPGSNAVLAAVVLDCAAETDALSTALLVAGPTGQQTIAGLRPGMRTLLAAQSNSGLSVTRTGMESAESKFSDANR